MVTPGHQNAEKAETGRYLWLLGSQSGLLGEFEDSEKPCLEKQQGEY